jgi:hypothetical protein
LAQERLHKSSIVAIFAAIPEQLINSKNLSISFSPDGEIIAFLPALRLEVPV